MLFGLLNFPEGSLAANYLIFCTVASLGAIQFAAARARLIGLLLVPPHVSAWLGLILVGGAYAWFFTVQPDLFIPGLAGGEFFAEFSTGFGLAVAVSLVFGFFAVRWRARSPYLPPPQREAVRLNDGTRVVLWLPRASNPPLILAFREASSDALQVLSGELVAGGAAVLLCEGATIEAALDFAEKHAARFHPTRRYALGVGRGADDALLLAARADAKLRAALALAPFVRKEHARPGLRWLRETDYLTAWQVAWRYRDIPPYRVPASAHIVYGLEDALVSPATARQLFPAALLVAEARHTTLAATPQVLRLAADLFDVRVPALATARVRAPAQPVRGEVQD